MMDSRGRVWLTSKIRPNQDPAWCADPANRFAAWFPLRTSGRQASVYDPKTKQFTLIDTCYSTHHLQFDNDANETLYFNELTGPIVGWIDTKVFEETKDEQKAAGWCGQVVDTNGDGRITRPWNQPAGRGGQGLAVPTRRSTPWSHFNLYAVVPSPVDNSVWGVSEQFPGYLVRVDRGTNPPESCRAEIFRVPEPGFDPRGVDIDTNGVVWTALAASSHLASFDRRKCTGTVGRKADGSDCREGWTLYQTKGPKLKGTDIPADFHYFNWVDRREHPGARREHAACDRIEFRFAARARPEDTTVADAARTVPARLLFAGTRRPHRRSAGGMERARALRQLRHALRLAHRGGQRHEGQAGEVPAAARSARALTAVHFWTDHLRPRA